MTETKHKVGKNPASLKNLVAGRTHSQNYTTRVASMFNWDSRVIRAAYESLRHHNAPMFAVESLEFYKLTPQRQQRIRECWSKYNKLINDMEEILMFIRSIKDTPLRTPEAHQERLRARRIARRRKEAAKP